MVQAVLSLAGGELGHGRVLASGGARSQPRAELCTSHNHVALRAEPVTRCEPVRTTYGNIKLIRLNRCEHVRTTGLGADGARYLSRPTPPDRRFVKTGPLRLASEQADKLGPSLCGGMSRPYSSTRTKLLMKLSIDLSPAGGGFDNLRSRPRALGGGS